MNICNYGDCTGCMACMNICPKNAITFKTDDLGKEIPSINEERCISCGLCSKVCPVNTKVKKLKPSKVYAVWSKNAEDQKYSSSGGVASIFARNVIEENGVVYGASCINGEIKHIGITENSEINALRGSKYVISYIGFVYKEVKEQLKKDKKVIFIGTPCQISGLKSFLGKEEENLITVDLICHGTPPQEYLKEHVRTVIKNKSYDGISFRGKYNYQFTVYNGDEVLYNQKFNCDDYFKAFSEKLILRENCYKCQYSCPERVSDITIGDFWGLNREKLKQKYDGRISVVLINTENGRKFFEKCKREMYWEEKSIEEAINPQQGNLLHPSIAHKQRKEFEENYLKYGFKKAVRKTTIGKEARRDRTKETLKKTFVIKIILKLRDMLLEK